MARSSLRRSRTSPMNQLAGLVLLQLVAGEHDQPARVEVFQGVGDERLSE